MVWPSALTADFFTPLAALELIRHLDHGEAVNQTDLIFTRMLYRADVRVKGHVYAEEFLLQNGKGSYWPVVIRTPGGADLIPPQALRYELQSARDT